MYYKLIQKIKQDSAERGMTDMPINVNSKLPAVKILAQEGVFVMPHENAQKQDIRPLRIAILNLMPMKMQTEVQLFTLLGCTPLQVEVTLLYPRTHTPKHTAHEYLDQFYKTFDQVQKSKFDGLIITGLLWDYHSLVTRIYTRSLAYPFCLKTLSSQSAESLVFSPDR